jgi:hypothetical protein
MLPSEELIFFLSHTTWAQSSGGGLRFFVESSTPPLPQQFPSLHETLNRLRIWNTGVDDPALFVSPLIEILDVLWTKAREMFVSLRCSTSKALGE